MFFIYHKKKEMIYIPVKVIVIILAGMTAYLVRMYIIRPKVLEPACLINGSSCVQLEYYHKDNSAFVVVRPSLYRLWFNGTNFFVYELSNTGRVCTEEGYQPAYEILPTRNVVQNYRCIRSVDQVLKYYEGVPKETVFIRSDDPTKFSAYDVIQYLLRERIIGLPTGP